MDRYTILPFKMPSMVENDDGEWVKYSDVEALQGDRDSAVELCERMKVALNRIGTKDSYVEWAKECREAYDQVEALQARVSGLSAAIGTVRELVGCVQRNVSDVSDETHTHEIVEQYEKLQARVRELEEGITAFLPHITTEGEALDNASLNEGRMGEYDRSSLQLRRLMKGTP